MSLPASRVLHLIAWRRLACACLVSIGAMSGSLAADPAGLASAPRWELSSAARLSAGWRENIFFSPFRPLNRGFARADVETFLWLPARHGWEFIAFAEGDVLRYVSPPAEARGEQQWTAHTEARWEPQAWLRLSTKLAGFYQDTVVDLSETEATRFVAPTAVYGGMLTPAVRFAGPKHLALELSVQGKRTNYREYAGDYDATRPGARLEWRPRGPFGFSAVIYEHRRAYRTRPQFTAGGRALRNTLLRLRQREGELRADVRWGRAAEWTLLAAASRLHNRDEASGYFNYDQKRARLELGWERAGWHATIGADAKRTDYLLQTVGAGISPPPRVADSYEAHARLERVWREHWTVFVDVRWERERSNQIEFSYRSSIGQLGIERRF